MDLFLMNRCDVEIEYIVWPLPIFYEALHGAFFPHFIWLEVFLSSTFIVKWDHNSNHWQPIKWWLMSYILRPWVQFKWRLCMIHSNELLLYLIEIVPISLAFSISFALSVPYLHAVFAFCLHAYSIVCTNHFSLYILLLLPLLVALNFKVECLWIFTF